MNRNVIAMTYITGNRLCDTHLDNPEEIFIEIMDQIKIAYSTGYIHGDLSEYNIMYDGNTTWIIDWPQWVPPDHENAGEILDHDLKTVCTFFNRKFRTSYDHNEIMREICGNSVSK
jgi:RIO kinase 2